MNQHRHARHEAKRARRRRRNGQAGRPPRAGHGPVARAACQAGLVKAGEDRIFVMSRAAAVTAARLERARKARAGWAGELRAAVRNAAKTAARAAR